MITARCPTCSYEYRIPPTFVGKKIKCKQESCGQVFKVTAEQIKPAEVIPEPPADELQPAEETYEVKSEAGYLEQDPQEYSEQLESNDSPGFTENHIPSSNSKYNSIIPEEVREFFTEDENILYAGRMSHLVLKIQLLFASLPFVIYLLILCFWASIGTDTSWISVIIASFVSFVIYAIVAFVIWLAWTNNVYVITNLRIIVRMGIFDRAIRIVPSKLVQTVTINTGLIARLLGLNSVKFTTAASSGGLPIPFFSQWFSSDGVVVFKFVNSKQVMRAYGTSISSPMG